MGGLAPPLLPLPLFPFPPWPSFLPFAFMWAYVGDAVAGRRRPPAARGIEEGGGEARTSEIRVGWGERTHRASQGEEGERHSLQRKKAEESTCAFQGVLHVALFWGGLGGGGFGPSPFPLPDPSQFGSMCD